MTSVMAGLAEKAQKDARCHPSLGVVLVSSILHRHLTSRSIQCRAQPSPLQALIVLNSVFALLYLYNSAQHVSPGQSVFVLAYSIQSPDVINVRCKHNSGLGA